jgi:hypothetical protein
MPTKVFWSVELKSTTFYINVTKLFSSLDHKISNDASASEVVEPLLDFADGKIKSEGNNLGRA